MFRRYLIAASFVVSLEAFWHHRLRAIVCRELGIVEGKGFWPRSTEGTR